jgi:hypothetical protein
MIIYFIYFKIIFIKVQDLQQLNFFKYNFPKPLPSPFHEKLINYPGALTNYNTIKY